jgi:hypothetical protein
VERDVRVPACEQSIHGSPNKHKGVVRVTRASCSRETGCSTVKWGDTAARTRVSTLVCSLSRACACGHVYSFGQEGRATPWRAGVCWPQKGRDLNLRCASTGWTGRAEGFDLSGVRASACRTTAAQPCGCRQQIGARRAFVETRSTQCKERSARIAVGSGTCKNRPARLDGRLSGDGRSARRREQASGNRQTTSSQASVQHRLEGRVHSMVMGWSWCSSVLRT